MFARMAVRDATARGPVRSEGLARRLATGALLAGLALFVRLVDRTLLGLDAEGVALAAVGAALGLVAIDGVTGIVHWACDTWGDPDTPVVGRLLIEGFREHHRLPQRMLEHDWLVVNREPALGATALLAALALPGPTRVLEDRPLLAGFAAAFLFVGAFSNQLHRWAHSPAPPRWVRGLQRAGLVLSPGRHARHHRPPRTAGYCIATGWLNPPLDGLGFWRAAEGAVSALTGARPRGAGPTQRERAGREERGT